MLQRRPLAARAFFLSLALLASAAACDSSSSQMNASAGSDGAGHSGVAGGNGDAGAQQLGSGGDGEAAAASAVGGSSLAGGRAGTSAGATASGGALGSAGSADSDPGGAGAFYPLGMNDVTILAPLPQSVTTPVLFGGSDLADDETALVPSALFDRLVKGPESGTPPLQPETYDRLQLVAVRFDLCDRHRPGACPADEDARMRLVFQPISAGPSASDVGFHAFYAIRNHEIAEAVAALRELAKSAPAQAGPLRVSPALSADDPEPYAAKLRLFVRRYGGSTRLVRLTVNMQPQTAAQIRWTLRGLEKQTGSFVEIPIAGGTATSEAVVFNGSPGSPSYQVTPSSDTPSGLLGAITALTFDAAEATQKREYLAALAAVDNPMSHTSETVPCVACHVSTVVMNQRAASNAIDPLLLPGRFSSKFDLSVAGGKSGETVFTIRALGYLGVQPMISQRVVNETAETLTELEARYPAP